jgi:hypothetical protein
MTGSSMIEPSDTPRKSTHSLGNQPRRADDAETNVALTAVPSRSIVIFREVRYVPLFTERPSQGASVMYQHVARQSTKLTVMTLHRCQAKDLLNA